MCVSQHVGLAIAANDSSPPSEKMGDIINNSGIITQGQTGNNTIYIVQAPAPEFRFLRVNAIASNADGTFARIFVIEIVAPYTPGTMVLAVKGSTVKAIGVNPMTQGMVQYGSWAKDDVHFVSIQNPFGKFEVNVTTTDATVTPSVEVGFNM
jgi:hypothetical protein